MERALGEKLFLKAHRCSSPKCAMIRKPYKPGVHGKARRRSLSDYGVQLKAKQKLKLSYGLNEAQLRSIYEDVSGKSGATGDKIIETLERRLDNAIFRSGLADSRIMARHFITGGHFVVNGRRTLSPSYGVTPGDVFSVREESKNLGPFKNLHQTLSKASMPNWLEVDAEKMAVKVRSIPPVDTDVTFNTGAVVEYFAKR